MLKTWQTGRWALRNDLAKSGTCRKCQAPVLRALVGRVAALEVTVEAEPLSSREDEERAADESCQTWFVTSGTTFPARILWMTKFHRKREHSVHKDHRCPQDQCRILTLREAIRIHDESRNR